MLMAESNTMDVFDISRFAAMCPSVPVKPILNSRHVLLERFTIAMRKKMLRLRAEADRLELLAERTQTQADWYGNLVDELL